MNEPHHAVAQPTTTRRQAVARAPAANQDSDSETPVGEYYDPDRRPDEFANLIKNQDMSRGIETDPRFHEHPEDQEQIFRISRRKRHAGSSKLTAREQLAGPCTIHNFEDDWGRVRSGHTLRDCRLFNELADDLKKEKQKEDRRNRRPEQSPPSSLEGRHSPLQGQVLMIQERRVPQTQRDAYTLQAKAAESINIVEVYQLHDTETSITFSQDDHPPAVPRPGHAPLVLDAQIGGYDMDRVFMDGGNSMNIIFASTLQKMLIP